MTHLEYFFLVQQDPLVTVQFLERYFIGLCCSRQHKLLHTVNGVVGHEVECYTGTKFFMKGKNFVPHSFFKKQVASWTYLRCSRPSPTWASCG